MVIFHSYVNVYQRVHRGILENHIETTGFYTQSNSGNSAKMSWVPWSGSSRKYHPEVDFPKVELFNRAQS